MEGGQSWPQPAFSRLYGKLVITSNDGRHRGQLAG